jgi:hypothetical protein
MSMTRSLVVPGALLLSFGLMRCSGPNPPSDDGTAGVAGKVSGSRGGSGGKGGSSSGEAGADHGTAGDTSAGGNSETETSSGGSKSTGGSHSTGGSKSTGGSHSTSGSANGESGASDVGAAGVAGETGVGGSSGTGGRTSTGGTLGGGGTSAGRGGSSGNGGSSGTGIVHGFGGEAGKAGASGTGGAAGSGTGGVAGSGTGGVAGSGGLVCGSGQGLALVTEPGADATAGWIDGSTDCVGIQGAVYLDMDAAGSDIYFTSRSGHICVAGHSTQVLDADYQTYWGANVIIQLNNPGNESAEPYNANTYGVDGFSFNLTTNGGTLPGIIRPTLNVDGSAVSYCKQICASGPQSVLLSNAHASCWNGTTGATPSATTLTQLTFSLPSNPDGDLNFDFCIDDLAAITNGVSIGNPGTCTSASTGGGSCSGHCGSSVNQVGCYCDSACGTYGDCCADYATYCL